MQRSNLSTTLVWAGIILVLATGLIHLVEAPENYEEIAYKGILFFMAASGSLVAAIGIYRGARVWGWSLGLLVNLCVLVGYILSRTVGLPGLEVDDEWLEPLGVASMVANVLFIGLYAYTMLVRTAPEERRKAARPSLSTR
jgi:hypothetical protein